MSSYLAMGGYAAFVWPAYGAAIGAIAILAWRSLGARTRARRLLASLEAGPDRAP